MNAAVVASIVVAALGTIGPFLVYRINKGSASTDAHQRELEGLRQDREDDREQFDKAVTKFEARQGRLELRIEQMEARERMFSDHILQLRWHIAEELPPPPPPFPPGLLKPFESQ